jgi:hypothetical protein
VLIIPPLAEYIRNARQKGVSDQDIKNELLSAGWDHTQVQQALVLTPPLPPSPQTSTEKQGDATANKKNSSHLPILLVITAMLIGGYAFLQNPKLFSSTSLTIGSQHFGPSGMNDQRDQLLGATLPSAPAVDKSKEVPLEQVNNLGYNFYLGEIEIANTTNVTDDLKNQITKIIYNAHFPERILKDTPIIILNNLALTPGQYVTTSNGNMQIPNLKADFLSEGGLYAQFTGNMAIIFINKS